MPEADEKPATSFEAGLQELESVVKQLESGDLPLSRKRSSCLKRGVQLSETCRKQLEEAETKVDASDDVRQVARSRRAVYDGAFLQYAPYTLRDANWEDLRESYADRVIDLIEEYAPNIRSIIIERQVLTPLDLERRFGITGSNIFHGEMSLDQMFVMRPVPGWARYKTPVRNLYLYGSGTHPGGGVMGAPGFNAAQRVLADTKG
jgi:exodeoxyribonuclease VII small subunit